MNLVNTNSLPDGVKNESFGANDGLKYDLVVGAGPAGCMAVLNAPSWMRILMVESTRLLDDHAAENHNRGRNCR